MTPAGVTLYTLPGCYACARAKRLLRRRGIEFHEVPVTRIGGRCGLLERTGGATVPQIVIDGEPIGGADALARLDRRRVLTSRVRRVPFPLARVSRRLSPARLIACPGSALRRRGCDPWRYAVELVDRDGRTLERTKAVSREHAEALTAGPSRPSSSPTAADGWKSNAHPRAAVSRAPCGAPTALGRRREQQR